MKHPLDSTAGLSRRSLLLASACMPGLLRAQDRFPSRTMTLMVPWPAGAPSDALARRLQPLWQRATGQSVIVDNMGGAGGTLGVNKALQQPPDGHTVLVGTPTEMVLSPQTLPAIRYRAEDFTMLAHFGRVPYVLCGRAGLPQGTPAELVASAAQGGRPLNIGNIGAGSLMQLISLSLERATGLRFTHVPYRGVPPMLQDLLGGQLDLAFLPLAGSIVAQIDQSRLRVFGITALQPAPLFPQFQTLAAGRPRLQGFAFDAWGGLFVRRETPAPVQQQLHALWTEATRDSEFLGWMRSTGSDPLPVLEQTEAQAFYARETARYTALLREFPEALTR